MSRCDHQGKDPGKNTACGSCQQAAGDEKEIDGVIGEPAYCTLGSPMASNCPIQKIGGNCGDKG